VPIWAFPHFVVIAAQNAKPPYLLLANEDPKTASMVGMMAAAGSLDLLDIPHRRLWGDFSEKNVTEKAMQFIRANNAIHELRGQQYGLIGGRSLGMYTAIADPRLWQKIFGVDIEHIDQLLLVEEAAKVPAADIDRHFEWLKKNIGYIGFDDSLTEDKLKQQVAFYLATKKVTKDQQLDFIGVKCQPELSEEHCTQCITAAFINDPYDADGPKETTVMACEVDMDGAMTMQILKLVSGGKPAIFFDFRTYDSSIGAYTFCNCGAQSTWYAARSDDPAVNLKQVHLLPQAFYYKAGGAATNFVNAPGEVTLARLSRRGPDYWMAIMHGEFIEQPREKCQETTPQWPHAFVKVDVEPDVLIGEYASNHGHAVAGDYVEELVLFCETLGIEPRVFGKK
jgi:L-fucose isomerase